MTAQGICKWHSFCQSVSTKIFLSGASKGCLLWFMTFSNQAVRKEEPFGQKLLATLVSTMRNVLYLTSFDFAHLWKSSIICPITMLQQMNKWKWFLQLFFIIWDFLQQLCHLTMMHFLHPATGIVMNTK